MSTAAGTSEWQWPRAPGKPRPTRVKRADTVGIPRVALQAVAFLALAVFAAAHWTALVEPAQTRRALVSAFVVTTGGVLLSATRRLPRAPGLLVRIVLVVATLVLAVTAIGIRFKLLMPAGWSTLGDRVSGGLSVVGSVSTWPYSGPNVWLRLTTLLAAPLVMTAAAALAFWPGTPGRARTSRRTAALVLLVLLYGVAVAARPFDHQGLRGVGLLACLIAWLWLPRLRGRDAVAAATAIGVAALAALLLTPKLASSDPWLDYRQWSWTLHKEKTISFDWRQSYGPLHWPRKNTTLLLIKSKQPEYWKAETLDEFDGYRWTTPPLAQRDPIVVDRELAQNSKWVHSATVTVRALTSQLVVAPGTILELHGLDEKQPLYLSNGAYLLKDRLRSGDTYSVRSYTPDPTAKQMRAAPPPEQFFNRYTTIKLPDSRGFVASEVSMPLRGVPQTGDPGAAEALAGSHYARVYALAKQIAAGAGSDYEIVRRVGSYLQSHYAYSEHVPNHRYPLSAFLFRDRRGYCQQFSGAAALMLRMLGVPTRVAGGFAPGTINDETHEYVVSDLDAHAWIEVWFEGLGWVPFDPTPTLAPAASQAASFAPSEVAASAARGNVKDRLVKKNLDRLLGNTPSGHGGRGLAPEQHSIPWGWIALGVVCGGLALAALLVALLRLRPGRAPLPPRCGDPNVDHLVRVLTRLGLEIPPGSTLLEIERRVERLGGAEAALYARQLRRRRFAGAQDPAPDRWDRRKLRLTLASATGAGPLTRLRMALPTLDRTRS